MTCDAVKGLVQVPCIERNGLGAIEAVSAASLSLRGDGTHLVPLDATIETTRQMGRDVPNLLRAGRAHNRLGIVLPASSIFEKP